MATKDTNYLVAVHKGLDESLEKQVAALPEKFNKQRFLQNCMTVLQDGQADFSKCEAPTVVRTLLKGAFLGLDFFNGECYAIPYGNQCQFQTDYKGEIKLCKRYSSNPIQLVQRGSRWFADCELRQFSVERGHVRWRVVRL